jgi:formylglycine-generating enzyme required for sulfatase activity
MKTFLSSVAATVVCSAMIATNIFALDISSSNAEKWKIKSKKGKTTLVAKGINTAKPLTDYFMKGSPATLCLKPARSVADTNDLRILMPIANKKGVVKKWVYKKKNDAILMYKPKKKLLKCKVWKEYPETAVIYLLDPFRFIPSGSFQMGDTFSEGAAEELPLHNVFISGFFIDTHEVSNEKMRMILQWAYNNNKLCANATTVSNKYASKQLLLHMISYCQISFSNGLFSVRPGKEQYPCVAVTWHGACAYCNFKSEREGLGPCYDLADWSCNWLTNGYRLPTEAEWEKAARGGEAGHRFPWHDYDTISHDRANYYSEWDSGVPYYPYDNAVSPGYHPDYTNSFKPYTSPVGSFAANDYGLYDMSGNVYEWCWDWYDLNWYSQPSATESNTRGPTGGTYRVERGGSWSSMAPQCRSAFRRSGNPTVVGSTRGFRCARQ